MTEPPDGGSASFVLHPARGEQLSLVRWAFFPVVLGLVHAVLFSTVLHLDPMYSGVVIALVLLLGVRRGGYWWHGVLVVLGTWVVADLVRPNGWQWEIGVVSTAVLLAVGLEGLPTDPNGRSRTWRGSIAGIAAAAALAGPALVAGNLVFGSLLLNGFAMGVVAIATVVPSARRRAEQHSAALIAIGALGVASGAILGPASSGPAAWALGGIAAAATLVVLGGNLRWQVPTLVVWVVGALLLGGRSCGLGGLVFAAVAALGVEAVPQLRGRSWLRGTALAPWLLVGALGLLRFTEARNAIVLLGLIASVALASVCPWPASVIQVARARGLRRQMGASADAVRRLIESAAEAVGRGGAVLWPVVARVGAWWAAVTWPDAGTSSIASVPDAAGAGTGRRARLQGAASYLVPVAVWTTGAIFVPLLARIMNSYIFGAEVSVRSAFQPPWTSDPTGRIGWGTGDYWAIADHGYWLSEHREAAFPLVGLAARWVHQWASIEIAPAQVWVASASGLAASILFWALLRVRAVRPRARFVALVLLFVYPYSFVFFGYGYSDPTLVALVLGAFVLVEHRRPVLAGLVGALATATRPNALPLVPALLVFELVRSGAVQVSSLPIGRAVMTWRPRDVLQVRRGTMRPAQWGVLLSLGGVGAYSWWLIGHAGSPLYWLTAQSYYGHSSVLSPRTWLKTDFLNNPSTIVTNLPWGANEAVTVALLVGAIAMIGPVHRRLGAGYSWFVAGVLIIAWVGPRGFAPGGRYLLPALPFILIPVAEWLAERARMLALVLSVCVTGTVLLVSAFPLGGWLWLEW